MDSYGRGASSLSIVGRLSLIGVSIIGGFTVYKLCVCVCVSIAKCI